MDKIFSNIKLIFILMSIIIIGCKKELAVPLLPEIAFIPDSIYLWTDTTLSSGDTALIAVNCKWNGKDNLKTINTYMNKNQIGDTHVVDDSIGEQLTFSVKIT